MKRLFICVIALMLLISACGTKTAKFNGTETLEQSQTNELTPKPEVSVLSGELSDEDMLEVQLSNELGLLPDNLIGSYDDPVSFQNMVELSTNAVNLYYGEDVTPNLSALGISQDSLSITRIQAAIILTETTKAAWGEYPWPSRPNSPVGLTNLISADEELVRFTTSKGQAPIRLWSDVLWSVQVVSLLFATQQTDKITGKFLIPLDEELKFNPDAPMTQLEAIQAAFRLYRSFDPKPEYVSIEDVSIHTIPKELYSGESSLPDASNQIIPAWRGVAYFPKCWAHPEAGGKYHDWNYRESDFVAIHDAGLNMVSIYISPTRLSFPYGDNDITKINLVELELLDQALAWAFENNLHVQLVLNGVPGVPYNDFAETYNWSLLFSDSEKARMLSDYWRMLARRYSDIPNKYLGFGLLNEVGATNEEEYLRVLGPAVDVIWEESPDRLITADIHSIGITGESMAKKGVALSSHLYALPLFDYNLISKDGGNLMDLYPRYVQDLTWPQLYLPSMLHGNENKITLTGPFTTGSLTIGVNQVSDGNETLGVRIDGIEELAEPITAFNERNNWNLLEVNKEYTVTIPEGANEIEVYNAKYSGLVVLSRLKIKQDGKQSINIYPHDTFNINWEPESVTIQIGADGSLTGNRFITWEDIKSMGGDQSYNAIKAVAEKHNVGFFVGEFGPFGEDGLPPAVLDGYLSMMMDGFKKDGVGWAHAELVGTQSLLYTNPELLPQFVFEPIENSPYFVNRFIKDIITKNIGPD